MTQLRDQLRQACAEHRSAAYPGDLADELLPRRVVGGGSRWFWSTAVGGAAAAAAVVLAVVHQGAVPAGSPAGKPVPHVAMATPEAAAPTPVVYTWPARMPLTIPVAPLMPTSPPVLVSLDGFPANLGPLQQSYEELPKFFRQFNPRGSGRPAEGPLPEKGSALPVQATQQSA